MTGLRQGELIALRWKDIDWSAGRIRVRQNYVRGEFGSTKSKRSAGDADYQPSEHERELVARALGSQLVPERELAAWRTVASFGCFCRRCPPVRFRWTVSSARTGQATADSWAERCTQRRTPSAATAVAKPAAA